MTFANPPTPYQVASLVLWVEDRCTRTYLAECWQNDPEIQIRIAGSGDSVMAIVRHDEGSGAPNVFGYRDRDFGATNRPQWGDPASTHVLRSEAHEIENHLLDASAIASCFLNKGKRIAADIELRMRGIAMRMPWFLACRRVLTEIRSHVTDSFPPHPGYVSVIDAASAEAFIATTSWYRQVAARVGEVTAADYLSRQLPTHHQAFEAMLASSEWLVHFPGKEIFRDLRDWVYPGTTPAGEARDAELARAIAQEQVRAGRIPQEIIDLRAAIRTRVGLQA